MYATSPHIFIPLCNLRSSGKVYVQPPIKLRSRRHIASISVARSSSQEVDYELVSFWDYQFLFVSQRSELSHPVKLKLVDGALPKDFPSGTYYLNGPGLFVDDNGSTVNPLDGHGYVRAFEIDGVHGEIRFLAKYVKTEAQKEECNLGNGSCQFTYRGPFSLLKGGKMFGNLKVMKNVANTSILKWGGRLFCLWEGGSPYEIDPQTLDTIGSANFINFNDVENKNVFYDESCIKQGRVWDVMAHMLKPVLQDVFEMPSRRLLAHYKIDAKRQRLIVMTCNAEDMILPTSHYIIYEFDMDFVLLERRDFNIAAHTMIHDWAFTDTHYILFTNYVRLDLLGSMLSISGIKPMISSLSIDCSKSTSSIYIFSRFPKSKDNSHCKYDTQPFEAPPLWLLHIANAYEHEDNDGNLWIHVHASVCGYEWLNFQTMFGYNWQSDILEPSRMNCTNGKEQVFPHLIKVIIKLERRSDHQSCSMTQLSEWRCSSDFPIINPQCSGYYHRYVYVASSSGVDRALPHFPFDTVVKLDTLNETSHTWSPGVRRFIGEPMFVSRGPLVEDNGYLLVVEYVASQRRCNLLILDAKEIGERGAFCARFEVPKALAFSLGFHGIWIPKD